MNRWMKFLVDKQYQFEVLDRRGKFNAWSDEKYLKRKYQNTFGEKLDLNNPKTFNQKLQWLKLNDRNPIYTTMVDKFEVKKFISERIGEEFVIPNLGVWDNFDEIDFGALPNQFVLKCTHDSGGLVVVRDKSKLDKEAARKKIEKSLARNYYLHGREWPYKDVKPRIIAEKYMQDGELNHLTVYKIFNFNGEPRIIQTIQNDKTSEETIDYFDLNWNRLELRQNFPNSQMASPKPKNLDRMIELAKILSENSSPFIRTDFYEINGQVYFSEFTFYSDSGFAPFYPNKWDEVLGEWIHISE